MTKPGLDLPLTFIGRCTIYKEEKPIRVRPSTGKSYSWCRECARKRAKRGQRAAQQAAYREANRELTREKVRIYREANRERLRNDQREHRAANPEMCAAIQRKRRAAKRGAPINDLSAADWQLIKLDQQGRCWYCDEECNAVDYEKLAKQFPALRGRR